MTISGSDRSNQNKTIYDTTPPSQVTGLVTDTPTQTTVNLSWNPVPDANYYQLFRNSTSLGYTLNPYWNDTGLTPDMLYQYKVRANDSYNNWGQNSSLLNVNTAYIPKYNVSGYVFDNSGIGLAGVLVQNGSYQNTTISSGLYFITGLSNGSYNISYSRPGFNTGYLEVTINGFDLSNQNKTIYDTTPPSQVTGLVTDTPTQTTVNLSWNPVPDANYYQLFRNSTSLGYTLNPYWNDTGLTPDMLYQYKVRANDSYNNWGMNSSVLNVNTAYVPRYNVSGYVFDNSGIGLAGVLVQNGSYQNTTSTSGIYLITGLSNGTYNISYSRPGFNTGYLEVTISGFDLSNQNKTIYDTTPPSQVTGLVTDTRPRQQ